MYITGYLFAVAFCGWIHIIIKSVNGLYGGILSAACSVFPSSHHDLSYPRLVCSLRRVSIFHCGANAEKRYICVMFKFPRPVVLLRYVHTKRRFTTRHGEC